MDARLRRSRDALVAAVITLAHERGIDQLSVTDVAAAAGVSRDTFYRHAGDPIELLADALREELFASLERYLDMPVDSPTDESVFAAPARAVMGHMREHKAIYRQVPDSLMGAKLHAVIRSGAAAVIGGHLENHPEIVPEILRPLDGRTAEMAVAYASAGATAAFFAWLSGDELGDLRRGAEIVLSSGPQWWLGATAAGPRSTVGG